MNWNDCNKNFIRRVKVDPERAESLKEMALKRLKRARVGNETEFIVEDYYEVIKELLIAYLLTNGLRSKNHQCLISYFLKEHPEYEAEAYLIQQMSYFRNRLEYYGESVPKEFLDNNRDEFENITAIILDLC